MEGKRMNTSTVIRGTLPFHRRGSAQEHDPTPATEKAKANSSRIPRIAQLVALARHIDDLVRSGALGSYAAAARLGHVSRARMSQIVALVHLSPDLQEQLLFLQRPVRGRTAPVLRQVLQVAAVLDWDEQRRRWRRLQRASRRGRPTTPDT
jgi:hypothetical protein